MMGAYNTQITAIPQATSAHVKLLREPELQRYGQEVYFKKTSPEAAAKAFIKELQGEIGLGVVVPRPRLVIGTSARRRSCRVPMPGSSGVVESRIATSVTCA
ncbi:hypothetical protein ACFWHV_30655 [Streptomyces collinus]|uniref:hypothetical protein n=1 Tax=Streptomyces collinus TaxID=42684 RepID=UPI003652CE39